MHVDDLFSLLREFDALGTLGGFNRPDNSGARGQGAEKNFKPLADKGSDWPYDTDSNVVYGQPTGPAGLDRGTRPGTDVHGAPEEGDFGGFHEKDKGGAPVPSAKYDSTWDVNEAMGTPTNFSQAYRGGQGMGSSVPGSSGGWAHDPPRENDGEDPRKNPMLDEDEEGLNMTVKSFFDPNQPPLEELENPGAANLKDNSDEELETRIDRINTKKGEELEHESDDDEEDFDPHIGDDGDPERFTGRLADTNQAVSPSAFTMSPDKLGSARGTMGMMPNSVDSAKFTPHGNSAWDDVEIIFRGRKAQNPKES